MRTIGLVLLLAGAALPAGKPEGFGLLDQRRTARLEKKLAPKINAREDRHADRWQAMGTTFFWLRIGKATARPNCTRPRAT